MATFVPQRNMRIILITCWNPLLLEKKLLIFYYIITIKSRNNSNNKSRRSKMCNHSIDLLLATNARIIIRYWCLVYRFVQHEQASSRSLQSVCNISCEMLLCSRHLLFSWSLALPKMSVALFPFHFLLAIVIDIGLAFGSDVCYYVNVMRLSICL